MLTSKAFDKRKGWFAEKARNEDLRVDYFQKSTRSSGATPIGHPMNHHPRRSKMLTSKAQGKAKASLTTKKARVEDESDFWEYLKWRPSSGLSAKIHSKLGGYTQVHPMDFTVRQCKMLTFEAQTRDKTPNFEE
jgi:hypothetical protein